MLSTDQLEESQRQCEARRSFHEPSLLLSREFGLLVLQRTVLSDEQAHQPIVKDGEEKEVQKKEKNGGKVKLQNGDRMFTQQGFGGSPLFQLALPSIYLLEKDP